MAPYRLIMMRRGLSDPFLDAMAQMEQQNYMPVNLESLKVGMLVERPLYVYLASNQRYIQLVKPLHPLEDTALVKICRLGSVFSTEPSIDARYPQLSPSARAVAELCAEESIAPFERNGKICSATKWLVKHVLHPDADALAALFFFYMAFGVPKPETMIFLSDFSVEVYERSLKLAASAGILALWLGYSEAGFLAQFAEAVFCHEVGLAMIKDGLVPGVSSLDGRFAALMEEERRADELREIVDVARWLNGSTNKQGEQILSCRVARKLEQQFQVNMMALEPGKAVA